MQPPVNTGSFGAAAGGMTPELQAAMQRRAGGGNPTAQVTNSAPTANPQPQAPQPPMQQPSGPVSSPAPVEPGGGGMTTPTTEASTILKAMSNRLNMLSKAGVFA